MNKVKILVRLHEIVTLVSVIQKMVKAKDYPDDARTNRVLGYLDKTVCSLRLALKRLLDGEESLQSGVTLEDVRCDNARKASP